MNVDIILRRSYNAFDYIPDFNDWPIIVDMDINDVYRFEQSACTLKLIFTPATSINTKYIKTLNNSSERTIMVYFENSRDENIIANYLNNGVFTPGKPIHAEYDII